MAKAKIICTLGPASETVEVLEGMVAAGMNVARLNFSHGDHEEHALRVRRLRAVSKRLGKPVAILQDIQGPKIRLGLFEDGQLNVATGDTVTLTTRRVRGHGNLIPCDVPSLVKDVRPGHPVLLDDGRVRLRVLRVRGTEIAAKVEVGGLLKDRKGLNLPGAPVSVRTITPKDVRDLAFGQQLGVDYVAISFVRSAADMREARRRLKGADTPLIAKIEKPQAVAALQEIALACEGIMVARGDLGVEMPLESIPLIQKRMIDDTNRLGKISIVATEMLESMINNARPTRAEVSDVANAIFDGADAVMLSGETASGKNPVQAVETMRRILEEAESKPLTRKFVPFEHSEEISTGVAAAAMAAADQMKVETIVAYTESGHTARLISEYRPQARILALTPNPEIVRRVQLYWGVEGRHVGRLQSTDAMVQQVRRMCREDKRCTAGKPVIIVAGIPLNEPGNTNMMFVQQL